MQVSDQGLAFIYFSGIYKILSQVKKATQSITEKAATLQKKAYLNIKFIRK